MRYLVYYHDECDGIIVTAPDAKGIVDRARSKTIPLLAVGKGLLSCASPAGPAGSGTIILRTGSRPQEWFSGAEMIKRSLNSTIDSAHASKYRLPLSGMTLEQHGAIYDLEDHPFLVGIGWFPEADDPIWLAFCRAVDRVK